MHAEAAGIILRDMRRLSDGVTSDSISAIFCIVVMMGEPLRQHSRTSCLSPLLHDSKHQGIGWYRRPDTLSMLGACVNLELDALNSFTENP